ncbi:NAD(P)-dependent oxidoreductase [Bacillus carboniphilus]|uniref:NAD(P)-dependent oxidoreductase n=1 Tax=Bacillus carboniphilus TaxID=86663 RepID=A0ABY9JTW7_9BACI|nr:NAD(P)-dependent oxidoreductase [Bacillus carboniphilus]WLR42254.1 NAD(P)-dependent oxidoreductase [Bacillus carboniphilus]
MVKALKDQKSMELILTDINISESIFGQPTVFLDVSNLDQCQEALKGVDIVIHLAGDPSPDADFYGSLLEANIKGTYNILRAAKDNEVSRVIIASSAQTVEGYPLDYQVHEHFPVRPKNVYGVSKVFGEALASYFAYQENLQTIAIRIGAYDEFKDGEAMSARNMSAYLNPKDFINLLLNSIEADNLPPFTILHGISNNRFKRLSLDQTKKLVGYDPTSDAFQLNRISLFDE